MVGVPGRGTVQKTKQGLSYYPHSRPRSDLEGKIISIVDSLYP